MITATLREVYYRARGAAQLSGVSLDFFEGEVVALMGRPEAQLVLRLLSGLDRPRSGSVNVLGHDPYREGAVKRDIGYAARPQRLPAALTVREFLRLCGRLRGVDADVEGIAGEMGIEDILGLRISRLSPPRAWLVALSGALVHRPRVLLLDEPLAGLGPLDAVRVREVIAAKVRDGRTVVIASSDLSLASILERVVVMLGGRVAAVGRISELGSLLGREDHVVIHTPHAGRALELASKIPYVKKLGLVRPRALRLWLKDLEVDLWPTLDLLAGMGIGIEGVSMVKMDPASALGELLRKIGERKT